MADKSMMTALAAALLTCAAPAAAQDFPDGPGKETVVASCGGCHDINRLKVGYTPDGWRKVMRMMENMEVPVPKDQWATVTDYLIKFLPERARPPAVIVAGPVEATVKVWPVPTPGSRPHDPLATRDGALWWTGQLSNRLGKLDPKTGEMKEFTLKSRHTGPHGLTEDKQGNIWFTGNNTALIGKFDPKTGATTEYPLPDPAAKDPHTLIFDNTGILWFTVQQANMLGRLDPATGAIKLVTSPTPKSRKSSKTSRACDAASERGSRRARGGSDRAGNDRSRDEKVDHAVDARHAAGEHDDRSALRLRLDRAAKLDAALMHRDR